MRNEWYNTAAFVSPATGTYGNSGTNSLSSAHVSEMDMSLFKNFPIGEQWSLNFRAEVFNIFNFQNYGVPDNNISDPTAGVITNNVTTPRELQLGVHLTF